MTQFRVKHGPYEEANAKLSGAVSQMGAILRDLNGVLKNMETATQGKALPLWEERQKSWNASYTDMNTRLSSGQTSSMHAAEVFQAGDDQGARIIAS
ncbi:WXG100 family type VII secretion target [Saccharopolyspora sp. NPDC003752]